MARLVLKFQSQVLREIPISARALNIGRAPDNDLHLDHLAVSDHHARLFPDDGRIVIEDLGSLNGTFVNDQRISRTALRDGDNIQIGEYLLLLDTVHEASTTVADSVSEARKTAAPARPVAMALDLAHAPTLQVLRGRTEQLEYLISAKLTVIGKSAPATVRLLGWFAPAVAAQINHHPDGYYLSRGDTVPKLNGTPIQSATRLNDGDIIDVARVRLQFRLHS
jgi:predicted component of type VI protein secretion system